MILSAAGDRSAFGEVVGRHGSFALRVASRVIPDHSIAEEIVQEALTRAWQQSAKFCPRRARLSTWLYRIVMNLCLDHRRRTRPESLPEGFEPVDPESSAQVKLEFAERDRDLARAIETLPATQRAVVVLVYEEGLPGARVACVMGISVKAVEGHLARARASLRESLREKHA